MIVPYEWQLNWNYHFIMWIWPLHCLSLTCFTQSSSKAIRTHAIKWVQVSVRGANTPIQTRVLPAETRTLTWRNKPWGANEINKEKLAYHRDGRSDSSCSWVRSFQWVIYSIRFPNHKQCCGKGSPHYAHDYWKQLYVHLDTVPKHFCPFELTQHFFGQVN